MTATIPWLHKVIVAPTLDYMAAEGVGAWANSEGAQAILLGIAAVESNLSATRQHNNGPARSYFQVEPATALDVFERRKKLWGELVYAWLPTDVPLGGQRFNDLLRYDQSFACMLARLKLMDAPPALPEWHDVGGQAAYWKRFYNTALGAGKPEHYETQFARHNILTYLEGEFGPVET